MDVPSINNEIIFVLKRLGVPASCRQKEDPRFVEAFTCDELEAYIANNPECTLFETLRDEDSYSVVRVFFDVDLDAILTGLDFVAAFEDFILSITDFVSRFACRECSADASEVCRNMRSNFSLTKSTNSERTSFHLVFPDTYTTLDTLIAMKRPLLELSRASDNPLIRAVDPAVFRRRTTLRIVGTRKNPQDDNVHIKQPPHDDISDYLFSYVYMDEDSCYFTLDRRVEDYLPEGLWEPSFISFKDAMKKVSKTVVNEIINLNDFNENNFTTTPLIIDYISPCAICKKRSHKHPHHLSLSNGVIRLYKSGNAHSCKVKMIALEGNRLFTIAQKIMDNNVIKLTDRGDHIVWLKDCWRFNNEEPLITKLVLSMRDKLPQEYSFDILCPRKRKVVENNLKDMLIDAVETDTHPEILPFNNGVMNVETGEFYSGNEAKKYICTVSTGYTHHDLDDLDSSVMNELENIINDIQPQTSENAKNRELYERILSSCLCGTTKPCLIFFYGETATGKSTTKRLLQSAIGGLFVETGQTILTEIMDKGPNPFVANMHLKRSVFCSELPDFACIGAKKIRADNIKKLTEPCIVGRPCFSNRINNRNHATIIIDTNYKPIFDRVDNALMRRVALVKFRTHFTPPSGRIAAENNAAYDKVKLLDETLDSKIQRNYFRFAFLRLLIRWYQKHHVPVLKLEATPEAVPDFVFQLKVGSLIVASSSTHLKLMPHLSKIGYNVINEAVTLPTSVFQQRLAGHFNVRVYGHDIESFITRNKKFANISEEYMEYIFIEDIPSK